jgi:hypothetical protein
MQHNTRWDMTGDYGFSPDGRLYQVEYAREAVKRGQPRSYQGKRRCRPHRDKRVSSKLFEPPPSRRYSRSMTTIGVASSGLVGDARALVDRARIECQITPGLLRRGHRGRGARKETLRPHADLNPVPAGSGLRARPS